MNSEDKSIMQYFFRCNGSEIAAFCQFPQSSLYWSYVTIFLCFFVESIVLKGDVLAWLAVFSKFGKHLDYFLFI